MACLLTVTQMVIAYRGASSEDEADALWEAFHTLRDHGFISYDEWDRFFDITYHDWFAEDSTMED